MWLKALVSLVIAAPSALALLRFPCSQLVAERLDPLVTPGLVSPHLHQIVGGVCLRPLFNHARFISFLTT
ncbi:hypothetical protein FA15DRAFT_599492 [Coprinopsis marcescibilis]|uniref:DUF1996 domain-containing protein n=1 Tax=Coprinopsis marcescibilis TaxID=230819 RepID=A0A5C3KK78_COPMA|nr:hypothetical protein FA15DRAFT_599492 [Coprinopsis marcescibilis]